MTTAHNYCGYADGQLDRVENAISEAVRIRDRGPVTDWKQVRDDICTRWDLTDGDDIWQVERVLM